MLSEKLAGLIDYTSPGHSSGAAEGMTPAQVAAVRRVLKDLFQQAVLMEAIPLHPGITTRLELAEAAPVSMADVAARQDLRAAIACASIRVI